MCVCMCEIPACAWACVGQSGVEKAEKSTFTLSNVCEVLKSHVFFWHIMGAYEEHKKIRIYMPKPA